MEIPEECRDVLDALDSLASRAEELIVQGHWTPSHELREEYDAMVEAIPRNKLMPASIRRPLDWWVAVAAETGDAVIERRLRALFDAWIQVLRRIKFGQDAQA